MASKGYVGDRFPTRQAKKNTKWDVEFLLELSQFCYKLFKKEKFIAVLFPKHVRAGPVGNMY